MQTFITEQEFHQAAIDLVARLICDNASEYISTGNVSDIGEQSLEYLAQVAQNNELSITTINTYLQIIADENTNIRDFFDDNSF